MDTFTRYVPGERNSIEFESNFILHPHTLDVVSGTVCPVVKVTEFVLKNFPAISLPHAESPLQPHPQKGFEPAFHVDAIGYLTTPHKLF